MVASCEVVAIAMLKRRLQGGIGLIKECRSIRWSGGRRLEVISPDESGIFTVLTGEPPTGWEKNQGPENPATF
tara:strand:+ start:467 stop:685 length:219 start_codon:yes stop_codon:yes gene_type:complete